MEHGGCHGSSVGIVRESHTKVAVHGGGIEGPWVAVAECLESLVILGAPGKLAIIHMSVEDDEDVGVVGAGDLKFA